MKNLLYPLVFALSAFLFVYSCSTDEDDAPPPAAIVKKYTLAVTAGEGGTVSSSGGTYSQGTQVSITATPSSGFTFSQWSDGSTTNPITVTLNSNTNLSASFTAIINRYTLTVTAGEGGAVSTEGGTYDEGTEVTITATPAEGYEFIGWEGSDSTEASLTVTLGANTTLNALFESVFLSISEDFSDLNKTTSYYNNQKFFDEYFTKDFLEDLTHYESHSRFRVSGNDVVVLDYDNDNKQDIVAFGTSFCNEHPYSFHPGKFIIVSDYKGKRNKLVFDSSFHFYVRLLAGDFNNDGYIDVIGSSHDTKQNNLNSQEDTGGYQNLLPTKPIIIDLSSFPPKQYEVGVAQDTHDFTSGDVNNDGLIDFIQFPVPVYYNGSWNNEENVKPTISINNGNFTFTSYELVPDLEYNQWNAFSYELFDLNDDNALDVIVAYDIGEIKLSYTPLPMEKVELDIIGPIVLWGNNSGSFSLDNSSILSEQTLLTSNRMSSVLGYGFTDYDLDGDIDVFITTTRNEPNENLGSGLYYNTYYLLSFDNIGNNNFIESFPIDNPVDESMTIFTNFYFIKTVDIDKDGDIDLVPDGIPSWGKSYIGGLYWENTGGQFVRREND